MRFARARASLSCKRALPCSGRRCVCAKVSLVSAGAPRHDPALPARGITPGCSALRAACAFGGLSADQRRRNKILSYCAVAKNPPYYTTTKRHKHRGALRGTPGSACPQPEPNATELPSCAPISTNRQLRNDSGFGGGGMARRARAARAPEGQRPSPAPRGTSSTTFCAASFTWSSFTYRPRASVEGGTRMLGVGSAAGR